MAQLTAGEVARLAYAAGVTGEDDLTTAVAIAGFRGSPAPGESHGNPRRVNPRGTGAGLWQINPRAHPQLAAGGDLLDPEYNARAMVAVWREAGGFERPWRATITLTIPNRTKARRAARRVIAAGGRPTTPAAGGTTAQPVGLLEGAASLERLVCVLSRAEFWLRVGLAAIGLVLVLAGAVLVARDTRLGRQLVGAVTP